MVGQYETLQEAIDAAADGQTVKLLSDIDATSVLNVKNDAPEVEKSITIDGSKPDGGNYEINSTANRILIMHMT